MQKKPLHNFLKTGVNGSDTKQVYFLLIQGLSSLTGWLEKTYKKNIKRQEVLFHENSKRITDMNLLLEHESSREMTLLIF